MVIFTKIGYIHQIWFVLTILYGKKKIFMHHLSKRLFEYNFEVGASTSINPHYRLTIRAYKFSRVHKIHKNIEILSPKKFYPYGKILLDNLSSLKNLFFRLNGLLITHHTVMKLCIYSLYLYSINFCFSDISGTE